MIRKTLLITTLLIYGIYSFGQNYTTGAGIRLGGFSGFTIKHFISNKNALEGLLAINPYGFLITGLYEFQQPTNGRGLDWLIGGGAHVGAIGNNYAYWRYNNDRSGSWDAALGVDFIIGLEYTFESVPFSIGIDLKPAVNIVGNNPFLFDLGLSFRYNFQ